MRYKNKKGKYVKIKKDLFMYEVFEEITKKMKELYGTDIVNSIRDSKGGLYFRREYIKKYVDIQYNFWIRDTELYRKQEISEEKIREDEVKNNPITKRLKVISKKIEIGERNINKEVKKGLRELKSDINKADKRRKRRNMLLRRRRRKKSA